jgi:hypothetical protein
MNFFLRPTYTMRHEKNVDKLVYHEDMPEQLSCGASKIFSEWASACGLDQTTQTRQRPWSNQPNRPLRLALNTEPNAA